MQLMTAARFAGALTGTGVALLGIGSWQIARGADVPPTALTMKVDAIGELAVVPVGRVLAVGNLKLGVDHVGRFSVRNQTGSELRVRLAATAREQGLDEAVRAVVSVDGGRVAAISLGQLRRGVTLGVLRSGGERKVTITTSLDRSAPGVVADFDLKLSTRPLR